MASKWRFWGLYPVNGEQLYGDSQRAPAPPCLETRHTTYRLSRSVRPFFAQLTLLPNPQNHMLCNGLPVQDQEIGCSSSCHKCSQNAEYEVHVGNCRVRFRTCRLKDLTAVESSGRTNAVVVVVPQSRFCRCSRSVNQPMNRVFIKA